ncbi:MAG: large subunit of alpha-aminoadipate reductase [Cirrosporium novae-zelandiae]|nr:MAG: large subunit of alpha-aminoadipate reductase [Cirrosporium novae-zelandiae]
MNGVLPSEGHSQSALGRWKDRLQNLTVSHLTRDYPEPSQTDAEPTRRPIEAAREFPLPSTTLDALKTIKSAHAYDDFTILLTAYVALIRRLTGDEDLAIGTGEETGAEFVLRTAVEGKELFGALLAKTATGFKELAGDAVPLSELLNYLREGSGSQRLPILYRFGFFPSNKPKPDQELLSTTSGTTDLLVYFARPSSTKPDGNTPGSTTQSTVLRCYYNSRLFSSERISTIVSQIFQLLESAAANPNEPIGSLDIITKEQRAVLPDPTTDLHWSDFKGSIQDIFSQNALRHPDRLCVIETASPSSPRREFTYRHINEASNVLAHHLLKAGIERDEVVMVYAYRGVDLVVAVMGVLKAGATFTVLDPAYPADRQNIYLQVSRPRALINIAKATREVGELNEKVRKFIDDTLNLKTEVPGLEILADGSVVGGSVNGKDVLADLVSLKSEPPGVIVGPDSSPTLSFTSGSEGIPKGVRGRHFSLAYYFPWMSQTFGLSENDRFTMLSGIAHDPIQRDIFTPLFLGAQLLVPSKDDIANEKLAEWMQTYKATVTHLTPAMGQILVGGATAKFPSLKNAFFVGDVLMKRDCRLLQRLADNVTIINMFGSTETQRAVSYYRLPSHAESPDFLDSMKDIIPAGHGMYDVQVLVVNRTDPQKICGVGEVGELYVRAGGLAEGYLGLPDLTTKKFVPNWFVDSKKWIDQDQKKLEEQGTKEPWREFYKGPRDRMYRTGDLGRYLGDGSVECSGRADDQVKIRGFRVELGEISTHLSRHPMVREEITLVRRDKDEEQTLISYIVPEMKNWAKWLEERNLVDKGDMEGLVGMLTRFQPLRTELRDYLRTKLPAYSVPSVIIPLRKMPLNPNGKPNKPALPFPDTAELAAAAPRRLSTTKSALTDTERELAAIWRNILPKVHTLNGIRKEDSFFDLGGHSLLAQQMLSACRQNWGGLELNLSTIFRNPTLKGFSHEIELLQEDAEGFDGGADRENSQTNGVVEEDDYAEDAKRLTESLPQSFPSVEKLDFSKSLTVFLTGVTGFLGTYLLRELLSRSNPSLHIIAHVRTKGEPGISRLRSSCQAYGVWNPEWESQIETVSGNLNEPRLGLSEQEWSALAEKVDVIIHNGAQVHWLHRYKTLQAVNVASTMELLKFAAMGKPKQFGFVSSTSVLDSDHFVRLSDEILHAGGSGIPESDSLEGSAHGLTTGYGQSKWVGEYLLRRAGERGLKGAIIRPGYVTGDSKTGVTNTDDFLIRMVKGCIQLQSRPDINNTVNMVPVDHVAKIVVAASFHPPATPLGVAQITSHPRLRFNEFLGFLEEFGYEVKKTDYVPWKTALRKHIDTPPATSSPNNNSNEHQALATLRDFVTEDLPSSSKAPELDDSNAFAALKADSEWSGSLRLYGGVSGQTVGVYLAYLVKIGFIPPPTRRVREPLPEIRFDEAQREALKNVGGRGGLA